MMKNKLWIILSVLFVFLMGCSEIEALIGNSEKSVNKVSLLKISVDHPSAMQVAYYGYEIIMSDGTKREGRTASLPLAFNSIAYGTTSIKIDLFTQDGNCLSSKTKDLFIDSSYTEINFDFTSQGNSSQQDDTYLVFSLPTIPSGMLQARIILKQDSVVLYDKYEPISNGSSNLTVISPVSGNIDYIIEFLDAMNEVYFRNSSSIVANNGEFKTIAIGSLTEQKVLPLEFSLPSGNVPSNSQLIISTATQNAAIRYTTNGAEPNEASSLYNGPIIINETQVIKAIAYKNGVGSSLITERNYTINNQVTAAPQILTASGAYENSVNITIQNNDASAVIYYTTDGTTPNASSSLYQNGFALTEEGTHTVKAIASAAGKSPSTVVEKTFTITKEVQVDAPVITPSKNDFEDSATITINSVTAGAAIFYTLDGSTPTQSSSKYSSSIQLTEAKAYTLRAIAIFNGKSSTVTTKNFTITKKPIQETGVTIYYKGSSAPKI